MIEGYSRSILESHTVLALSSTVALGIAIARLAALVWSLSLNSSTLGSARLGTLGSLQNRPLAGCNTNLARKRIPMASLQQTIDTNVGTWCRYRYRYPDVNFELWIPIVKEHPGIDARIDAVIYHRCRQCDRVSTINTCSPILSIPATGPIMIRPTTDTDSRCGYRYRCRYMTTTIEYRLARPSEPSIPTNPC